MRRPHSVARLAGGGVLATLLTLGVLCLAPIIAGAQDAPSESSTIDSLVADLLAVPADNRADEFPELVESKISELVPKRLAADMDAVRADGVTLVQLDRVYQIEMERTDKQVGAGASSSASTSAAEKPGLPWLLGLAVEHGAITETSDETGLTLSTSPYALLMLGQDDTPDRYESLEWARRVGLSAVFPLTGDGSADERNFDPKSLSQVGAKVVLYGDRSPRSAWFVNRWNKEIRPEVETRLAEDTLLAESILEDPTVRLAVIEISKRVTEQAKAKLTAAARPADATSTLKTMVAVEIDSGLAAIDPNRWEKARQDVIVAAARRVASAYTTIGPEQQKLQGILDELEARPEVSLAYTYHQKLDDVDYSEIKLLADLQTEYVDFVANAGASFNHGDGLLTNAQGQILHRDGLRDISVSVALEKGFPNLNLFRVNDGGTSEITFSLTGRYEHLQDVDDDVGVGQAKVVIPLATGVDLPISVTYASRSEYIDEDEIRGNFGVTVDTDKLYSLARLYSTGLRN